MYLTLGFVSSSHPRESVCVVSLVHLAKYHVNALKYRINTCKLNGETKLKTGNEFVVRTDKTLRPPTTPRPTHADVFVSSFHLCMLSGNQQFFQCVKLSSEFI
jgi:hypothetical protein